MQDVTLYKNDLIEDAMNNNLTLVGNYTKFSHFDKIREKRNRYLKHLLFKNVGAIIISGASIILYYQSTQNQPMTVRFDSIGCNFVIDWWAGYITLDYLFPLESENVEIIPIENNEGCDTGKACKKLTAVIGAIICSLPYGIAAYTFTSGSLLKRLAFGAAQLAGNIPLYLYSIAQLIEDDLTKAYNFTSDLIQDVYCQGNDNQKQQRKDIDLVRRAVMKQFSLIIEEIKCGTLDLEGEAEKIPALPDEKLKHLVNKLPTTSNSVGFWQKGVGNALSFVGFVAKTAISTISADAILYGALGYHCSTQQQLNQEPFYLKDPASWAVSSIIMLPLYYLCLKGGWKCADTICDIGGDLAMGKPINSTIWKIAGKLGPIKFGPLFQFLLPIAAGLLSYQSGYTSRVLYEKQCPTSFQFKGAGDTVDYSTDIFNGIYTYYAISDGLLGLMNLVMNFQGNGADKTYLQLLTIAEATLDEIGKMSRARFLDYSQKSLITADDDTRIKLLGEPSVKIPLPKQGSPILSDHSNTINHSEEDTLVKKDHKHIDDNNAYDALERLARPTNINI